VDVGDGVSPRVIEAGHTWIGLIGYQASLKIVRDVPLTVDPPQDGFAVANMTKIGWSTDADIWRQQVDAFSKLTESSGSIRDHRTARPRL